MHRLRDIVFDSRVRAFLLLVCSVFLILKVGSLIDGDFFIFYQASSLFLHRLNPYNAAAHFETHGLGFTYPPMAIWLTLVPSLLPFGFALWVWDIFCLLCLMTTIYLWFDLIWGRKPSFLEFSQISVCAMIAPCQWAFWCHQLTIPVLFFGTVAFWLIERNKASFIPGILTGLMLVKPHLALFTFILFFVKAPKRSRFFVGLALVTLASFSPFLSGYRPFSDLSDMKHSMIKHSSNLWTRDEQNIVATIYKQLLPNHTKELIASLNPENHTSFSVPVRSAYPLQMLKKSLFLIALIIWSALLLTLKKLPDRHLAALSFGLGVLFSIYSHFYDGLLILPILLLGIHEAALRIKFPYIFVTLFYLNAALTFCLPFGRSLDLVQWDRTGYSALLYSLLALALLCTRFRWKTSRKRDVVNNTWSDRDYSMLAVR